MTQPLGLQNLKYHLALYRKRLPTPANSSQSMVPGPAASASHDYSSPGDADTG